jgi:lipopolysaccharide transport system ATP-binding protein
MSSTVAQAAIKVEGLGKQYRIGVDKQLLNTHTLRDAVANSISGLFRGRQDSSKTPSGVVWALRDCTLSVKEGEIIGIIGRNGSGKSTLLKILSDIVEPTEGRAEIRGRVASLLEVGTGFHSELTGRENVFLNGAMLGMKRYEVQRNFSKIVEFAGIGDYIDTPVKRYSSGMYTRLGFAVAAHLEPEVLIVDEVLAVGDYEFQQRCIGRMKEVGQGGRTVLFVSHNMAAVESLCNRCVLLDSGRLAMEGEPHDLTREYRRRLSEVGNQSFAKLDQVEGASRTQRLLQSACMVDDRGDLTTAIPVSRAFEIRIGVRAETKLDNIVFVVRIDNTFGGRVLTLRSPLKDTDCREVQGELEVVCKVNEFPLAPGSYTVGLAMLHRKQVIDEVPNALTLTVTEGDIFGEARGAPAGMVVARSDWSVGTPTQRPATLA